MNDLEAIGAYQAITKELAKMNTASAANPLAFRRNMEQRYAIAYQNLVKKGLARQIRGKYRKV